jgi:hypothetical protein
MGAAFDHPVSDPRWRYIGTAMGATRRRAAVVLMAQEFARAMQPSPRLTCRPAILFKR